MGVGPLTELPDLSRPVVEVAPLLLGCLLERITADGLTIVRLTEVEAYAGRGDPGSHARNGPTPRTAVMHGPPGRAYVYLSYGMHWCLNVVCEPAGTGAGVLLRAGQVVAGEELARARRPDSSDRDLARGPARLARALAVDKSLYGADLLDPASPLRLSATSPLLEGQAPGEQGAGAGAALVSSGPRVGVAGAGAAAPWRFWLAGDPTVSPFRAAVRRTR